MDWLSVLGVIAIFYQLLLFVVVPRAGLAFACLTICLTPLLILTETFSLGTLKVNMAGIYYASLAIGVLPSMLKELKRIVGNPNFKWVVVLLLYLACAMAYSAAPNQALRYWTHIFVDFSFYLMIPGLLRSREEISKILRWIGLSGIIPGLFAIYCFVSKTNLFPVQESLIGSTIFRVTGTFPSTSDLAFYMALIIPAQFFSIIMRRRTAKGIYMLLLPFAGIVSFAALILTFTRIPVLVLFLAIVLLMAGLLHRISKSKAMLFGGVVAVLLLSLIPYSLSQVARLGEHTLASRLLNWDIAMANVNSSSFFVGKGLESFRSITLGGQIHNDYLKLLLETGLIGLVIYLVILFREFFGQAKMFFLLRKRSFDQDLEVSCILMACFVQYIAVSFLDPLFGAGPFSTIFWIMAGCSRALVNIAAEGRRKKRHSYDEIAVNRPSSLDAA
jgi:O-antigen ligase